MLKTSLERERAKYKQNKNPKISFPIATYNRERILIERTLPTILSQSYANTEVVIVGDGVDSQREKYIRNNINDNRVRFYNLRRRTRYPEDPFSFWCVAGYRARNVAARLATGDFHWWISDDDEIATDGVARFLDAAEEDNYSSEVYSGDIQNADGSVLTSSIASKDHKLDIDLTGIPALITKSYILKILKFNGFSYQNTVNKPCDYDLYARLIALNVKFKYTPSILAKINPALPEFGLHGSRAYVKHPELFR